jgi:tetratricopeptide (TPR) repeat protein
MRIFGGSSRNEESESLYSIIVRQLEHGELDGLLSKAKRLQEIDPNSERADITRGIVELYSGLLPQAIGTLAQAIDKHGESGAALTNLAKAHHQAGSSDIAFELLRHSLHVDPNQNAGLMWYAKLCEERGGAEAINIAFEEISREADSWRSLLWMAREQLKLHDVQAALQLYRRAMSMGFDSDALLMISGDLGTFSLPDEAVTLVRPHYEPSLHGAQVGFNLLHAYLELKRPIEGKELLAHMRSVPWRESLEDKFSWFRQQFEEIS